MRKRLKDKKIIIYNYTNVAEPGNMPQKKWKPIHPGTLWAYVRQLSQKEWYGSAQTQNQEERLFVINWRSDIDTYMNIFYKGKWYEIVRIDPYEDYKSDLQIYVKEAIGGGIPREDDIIPYE